jgi:hypothetical protein
VAVVAGGAAGASTFACIGTSMLASVGASTAPSSFFSAAVSGVSCDGFSCGTESVSLQ